MRNSLRTGAAAAISIISLGAAPVTVSAGPVLRSAGPLVDLDLANPSAFEGAEARFQLVNTGTGSHAYLRITSISADAEGKTFGAHLHVGPCVAGSGAAAGAHYNTDVLAGITPPEISDRTEVWLDATVQDGTGRAQAKVPFQVIPGTRSVVVHAVATDHHAGTAGARLACLQVAWS